VSEQPTAGEAHTAAPTVADDLVETRHAAVVGGRRIRYRAICGTVVLREESEKEGEHAGVSAGHKPRASIFVAAYFREGVADVTRRPLTFAFNGGPGSAAVWLHLGALGPRRVEMGDAGSRLAPPYGLVDNADSLLDVSDLVFVDPVGTGYSRSLEGEKARDFHSLDRDVESVGEVIRLLTSRYGRWRSPTFLVGESYGTTRAAALARRLQARHGLYLNGIALVSLALDFSTLFFGGTRGNDLPNVLYLPAYTATAWYHRRLEPALQRHSLASVLAEAERFAVEEYAVALLRGDRLPPERRVAVARETARLVGLDAGWVERADLRLADQRFFKELLRGDGRTIGRLDSRFTGFDRDSAGESVEEDPSYQAILGPYATAWNDYVRGELGFASDLPYEVISQKTFEGWRWERDNDRVSVVDDLRAAIVANPSLQVLVASGLYDLATPYSAADYTVAHLGLPAELRGNIAVETYEAGHMMYVHPPSREKLKRDLVSLLRRAAGGSVRRPARAAGARGGARPRSSRSAR
jgi:carboxypeptidase C (cathepsin A)